MAITLPSYAAFDPASVYNVAVRIGNTAPGAGLDPSNVNALCQYFDGPLGSEPGDTVHIECNTPVAGRIVTIQIRSVEHGSRLPDIIPAAC